MRMPTEHPLVSICLPVRNGEEFLAETAESVLAQDHERLELIISDNASDDRTEEICRKLTQSDHRVRYHRQQRNIGLLNNFAEVQRLARGEFFKWIGDDDWLAPAYLSCCLAAFDKDPRLILVTTQQRYVSADGMSQTLPYDRTELHSPQPDVRFAEMLRLLTESHLLLDPLYGLMRLPVVRRIPRRNMLREDETFAATMALAGPFGHVSEILARRRTRPFTRLPVLAERLDVPRWRARMATALQCRALLHAIEQAGLDPRQRRRARAAVAHLYLRRHLRTAISRRRKLTAMLAGRTGEQVRSLGRADG
ncbi:MAG TPA: glycosyltransferase family A protein [Pseudonocardiaceae bacterium]|nr:glycosyltransferase family A protein [Pseudonocardiaceae bacterium]